VNDERHPLRESKDELNLRFFRELDRGHSAATGFLG
jgi:hypothetical protein